MFTQFNSAVSAQEQPLKFQQFTIEDGLSQSTVRGIIQDKYGFIWVGTQDGLNRYDGSGFKIFKNDLNNPHSLSANSIFSLYEDKNDRIWIGTELGLNLYDFDLERFENFAMNNNPNDFAGINRINAIYESESTPNFLWLGTMQSVYSFNINTKKFFEYRLPRVHQDSNTGNEIHSIFESISEPGILWIATSNGLFKFNTKTGNFNQILRDKLSSQYIISLYEDSENTIWICTNSGLHAYDKDNNQIKIFRNAPNNPNSISSSYVQSAYEDSRNQLWFGTVGGGLNTFDRKTKRFMSWKSQAGDPMSISNNNIWDIFEDQSGILWVCTGGNGLNKVNTNSKNFEHYFHKSDNPNSICGNTVRAIMTDSEGKLWIGSTSGISIINQQSGKYEHLFHHADNKNSISSNQIRVLYQDRLGFIWIGSRDGGLDKYDPELKIFKNYKNDINNKNSIGADNVTSIYEDTDGMLWIGTYNGGLNKFNPKTEKFKRYMRETHNPKSLNDNRVNNIVSDESGFLWIGTRNGFAKFNTKTEEFTRYISDPKNPKSLSHFYVLGISIDHDGNLWLATYGGGINKFNPKTEEFTVYKEEDGLPNNSVYIAIEDNNHNLWMTTNNGLTKFNPETEYFLNFNTYDGLQGSEFNAMAFHKDQEGLLYFGGINGFNVFNPDQISSKNFISPIVINDFQIFNKSIAPSEPLNTHPILTKSILETNSIELTHKENVFSFSFSSLDFSNPEKNEYAYILENFESEWNMAGTRNFVTYTNLPAGKYVFRVIGTNSAGIWNEEGKSIQIIILPPWWKTKIFYFLSALIIALALFLFIQIRIGKLSREKHKLEEHVKERTQEIQNKNIILKESELKLKEANATKDKFFSILAHDLKNPFNIIQGYADILNTEYDNFSESDRKRMVKEIDKSSKITYKLLENTLTWSRSQQGKIRIDKKNLNLKNLVTTSIESSTLNAKKKDIEILIDIQETTEIYADNFTLSTTIRNLVSNAIKYTAEGGRVKVKVLESDQEIKLSIQDNGIGMNMETMNNLFRIDESYSTPGTNNEVGTGLGLILCKEFVEMNSGTIEVESKIGKGSTFTISLSK